jgi:hypothetical protein
MLFKGAEHKFKDVEHKFKDAEHEFKVRKYKNCFEGETFVGQKRIFCRT